MRMRVLIYTYMRVYIYTLVVDEDECTGEIVQK
jgi:hypothetical protein